MTETPAANGLAVRARAAAAPLVLLALLLLVWEGACRALAVPSYFLPPPTAIGAALAIHAPDLFGSAAATLHMALTALACAVAVAWPLALLTSLSPTLQRAVQPLAVTLQVTPVVAIAPLAVIWAGLDHPERAITGLAAIVAFFPLFSGALTGLKAADPDLHRLFALYDADRLQTLVRLRLPSAVPHLLQGLKVATGLALIGAVVAEFVAGSGAARGLAWRILESGARLRTADMFAALFALAILGAGLYAGVEALERWAIRQWRGR